MKMKKLDWGARVPRVPPRSATENQYGSFSPLVLDRCTHREMRELQIYTAAEADCNEKSQARMGCTHVFHSTETNKFGFSINSLQ